MGQVLAVLAGAIAVSFVLRWLLIRRGKEVDIRSRFGPWAIVTGASAGLGEALAVALAKRKVNVVLVARRLERLQEVAASIRGLGVEARVVQADLLQPSGLQTVVEAVKDIEIGILINNAGEGYQGAFAEQDLKQLTNLIQLNCTSYVGLTHQLLPKLRAQKKGAIVLVSSVAAAQPLPLHALYGASKSFVSSFGAALHQELKKDGIHVLVTEPGSIKTEFASRASRGTGAQRGSTAEYVAEQTVLALAGEGGPVFLIGSPFEVLRTYLPSPVLFCKPIGRPLDPPRTISSFLPRKWVLPLAEMRMRKVLKEDR